MMQKYKFTFDNTGRRLIKCECDNENGSLIVYDGRLIVPEGVEVIGTDAFLNCRELYYIILPNSLRVIESCAFCCCTRLKSITIPENVQFIGINPFLWCVSLHNIHVTPNNKFFDSRDNCNAIIETKSNILKFGCSGSSIPKSVTAIEDHAFFKCMRLESITIPGNVKIIGQSFYECKNLRSIEICEGVLEIEKNAFQGCERLQKVIFPKSLRIIKDFAFCLCDKLKQVNLNEGLCQLGAHTFENLTSIIIPSSLVNIGIQAFGCHLESIVVSKNNPKYDSREDCNALIESGSNTLMIGSNNTIIPNDIKIIGKHAFDSCNELKEISIPNSCIRIEDYAFHYTEAIVNNLPGNLEHIGDYAFSNCHVHNIDLPKNLKHIGEGAFISCGLSSISLPESLIYLGANAFGYNEIFEINIPKNVQHVGYLGLKHCVKITVDPGNPTYDSRDNCNAIIESKKDAILSGCNSTTILSSIKVIGESSFRRCEDLTKVVIPNGVEEIERYAFCDCKNLKIVEIPSTVKSISLDAFISSEIQKMIVYWKDSASLPWNSLSNYIAQNITLYVPKLTTQIYKDNSWNNFKEIIEME